MGEPELEISENSNNLPGGDILFARLAYNLLQSGDVEEATKILEKGLRTYPSYAQAHYILAKCYMKQHLTDEARAELERVLRYDPNHSNAIKDISSMYFINGFQDLYKDYLLKLFTLNPLYEEVVDEVKKLGEYKLWASAAGDSSPVDLSHKDLKDDEIPEPEIPVVPPPKPENVEQEESSELIFPDKVDLSQFDNVQDDFTTILHGNLELPQKNMPREEDDLDLLKSKEEIFGGEEAEKKEDTDTTPEESLESMDDILGEDEELVIKQIRDTDDHLTIDDNEIELPDDTLKIPSDQEEIDQEMIEEPEVTQSEDQKEQIAIDNIIMEKPVSSSDQNKEKKTDADHPVADFDHFQDDEESKFDQPKIISQTLGEILVSQKKYSEAKSVFEALKEKTPENKSLDVKIAYLDKIIGLEKT